MSLYVVERDDPWRPLIRRHGWRAAFWRLPERTLELRDSGAHDGEWPAFITLPHETVEFEGRAVPVFEGDVERREWEAARRRARSGLASSPAPGAGGQRGR